MARLTDARRSVALDLDRFRIRSADGGCEYDAVFHRIGDGGQLEEWVRVSGNHESMRQLRQLGDHVRRAAAGELRACRFETMVEGFTIVIEQEGEMFRVECWIDLVRLNQAMHLLAMKGEPQVGIRFLVGVNELGRFWAELDEELDRAYS